MNSMSIFNRKLNQYQMTLKPLMLTFQLSLISLAMLAATFPVQSQTVLADKPIFTSLNAPGNLALVLSVEFPTAISVAHSDADATGGYSSTFVREYLGYFDPNKCYDYKYTDGVGVNNYFYPVGSSISPNSRTCASKWSGNFLNWASMQTIDPFRWVLTGGYRVIDDANLTVVERAWASNQGGEANFPDRSLNTIQVTGATPFPLGTSTVNIRNKSLGNKMRFTAPGVSVGGAFTGTYYNNISFTGSPVVTRNEATIDYEKFNKWIPGVNQDYMSAKWSGNVVAATAGTYTFRVRSDDGVRLFVGVNGGAQTPLIGGVDSGWRDQPPANYDSSNFTVAANAVFNIRIEYYQKAGGAEISLLWKKPGTATFTLVGADVATVASAASLTNDSIVEHYRGGLPVGGKAYEVFVRTKLCDPSASAGPLEANCIKYGDNYKPEGLMQKYSQKIRYSAFGYLNDPEYNGDPAKATRNKLRDGAVLRAQQKFIGPEKPQVNTSPVTNTESEWSSTTGVFTLNPNATDAANTAAIMGLPSGATVQNSGVINYLNKFGQITKNGYKTYDNVSELYYAAIRYFKNMPAVPEWTATSGVSDADRIQWTDGFPVITNPVDPIIYSCQKNFILGIGDVNTHADKNVPGNNITSYEPTMPAQVTADTTVNAVAATNLVGRMEGLGATLGTVNPYNGCCTNNSALIAGLAYHSHVNDIRPDLTGKQIIDTYWVDVLEYQRMVHNNQYYLATKYGGFTVPDNHVYGQTTALTETSWHTNTDNNFDIDTNKTQPRPDNYFSGARPDLVKAGLEGTFSKIAAAIGAYTTSFSLPLPQVSALGNASYSSQYDPNNWTSDIFATELTFDSNLKPSFVNKWNASTVLGSQLKNNGWNTDRRVVTWSGTQGVAFRSAQLTAANLSDLATSYVASNNTTNYINYLRGDQTNEIGSTAAGTTNAYRQRTKLLGDIVGSKVKVVGPPSFRYSDTANPGYSEFKKSRKDRGSVVYVGANDGMLHAFNGSLDTAVDANAGKEIFAYIPKALFKGPSTTPTPEVNGLSSLGKPDFEHHFMVDATPVVYDIDFGRTPTDTGTAQNNTPDWHSVLIGGLGKGGKSYYAIDVTNSETMLAASETSVAGKVLWEFSDARMGFTYGDPIVAKTKKYGWVVIFSSGYNNTDGKGYFFFVNPRTGALLEAVSTNTGSTTQDAGLAHPEAFMLDGTDGTADSVYAGDLLGNVWRVDLTTSSGNYAAPTKLAVLTDDATPANAQPVTSRPSIAIHPKTKKRYVMVGTGRLLNSTDISSTKLQSYYSLIDGSTTKFNVVTTPITRGLLVNNTNTLVGVTPSVAATKGWYLNLGAAPNTSSGAAGISWRVVLNSSTFLGAVNFASTLPNGDECNPEGDSRIYGLDFDTGLSNIGKFVVDPTTQKTALERSAYISIKGRVTDINNISVDGKDSLVVSDTKNGQTKIDREAQQNPTFRRLNWRELQTE
jgi:type IV pilus assembly protein PilY1